MTIRQTALVGFSPFETMTLESFFRLAGRRPPGYVIVPDANQAHVLVVNADNPSVVQQLWAQAPKAQVILIGASAHGTDWTLMARPIRLLAVLDMIEQLLMGKAMAPVQAATAVPVAPVVAAPTAAAPAPAATPAPARAVFMPEKAAALANAPAPAPSPAPAFKASRGGLMSFGNSEAPEVAVAASVSASPAAANDDDDLILVVDDSDIVLRFMQGRLQRFGYRVELASTGEQAVQMAQQRLYKFVFLDVMMPGIDGYQTCRMVKKHKHAGGTPVVVMLSSRGGSIDKIRGTLAGADAYLTKPLAEAALIKVLADHDTQTATNFSATRPASGLR